MKILDYHTRMLAGLSAGLAALALAASTSAFPLENVVFYQSPDFAGSNGVHSLTTSHEQGLLTVAAWADLNAAVPANIYQYFWLIGVDSGTGNGALIDGSESMTLAFEKGVGAANITFFYSGGSGGTGNGNLARITVRGFVSDPGAKAYTANAPRISNITYAGGTLSFDYLNDGPGTDYGQLILANPAASAGRTLIISDTISTNGNATSAFTGLYRVDSGEVFGGPTIYPAAVSLVPTNTYRSPDGAVTIRAFADNTATSPALMGSYLDECFGIAGPNAVQSSNSLTLQFTNGCGLSRLDSVYSSGAAIISGFTNDPGFTDPSGSSVGANYSAGTLIFFIQNSGLCSFYFTNRAASAGQTLMLTMTANQFGIAAVGYAPTNSLLGPDIPSNVSPTYATADSLLTLTGYADTPGTVPTNLFENVNWFGIAGGNNNQSIEGAESLKAQFAAGVGLAGLGTRYTSGQVVISGFTSDPGFNDPSGTATSISYSGGMLSYTFNSPHVPEIVVNFSNPQASAGQTLSLHTDGAPSSQLTLTRINYTKALVPVTLSIAKSGANVILTWPSGTLQQSTNISGGFSNVIGAGSPYTNSITGMQTFFRVQVQ